LYFIFSLETRLPQMVSQQSRFLANFTILILAHRIFPGQHSFTLF
jgi:hypothetical protein